MPKQKPNKPAPLSARYTYPEQEAIVRQADKLNYGDISGWARATSPGVRPNVRFETKRDFVGIKSLASITPVKPVEPTKHEPSSVVLPGELLDATNLSAKRVAALVAVRQKLDAHFKKVAKKTKKAKAKTVEAPAPTKGLLDDCPSVSPEALETMRGRSLERDEEAIAKEIRSVETYNNLHRQRSA
jgi:hypothetical protein